MTGVFREALAALRANRGRTLLSALGILAAALVAGAGAAVGFGLSTGFDRAADAADLPDVIARFSEQPRARVDARVRGLPNLQSRSYRFEVTKAPLRAGRDRTDRGVISIVLGGRRGYDVKEGRDLRGAGEVVVEAGVARAWGLRVGDTIGVGRRLGGMRIVGVASAPDNVAFPLAKTARVYILPDSLYRRFGERFELPVNYAQLWVNDRSQTAVTLASARTVAFGLGDLRFITRTGVRLIIDQAAGIVIALLVAFALVALVAAGTMLAANAHAEVQRRLPALGVRRAIGFTPASVVGVHAAEGLLVAAPVAAVGLGLGALAVSGPAGALLDALNEQGPGWALLGPLALVWLVVCVVVVSAATIPAWRAARRPIAPLLRGGDVSLRGVERRPRGGGRGFTRIARSAPTTPSRERDVEVTKGRGGGLFATGARFAVAARGRWAGSVATLAVCAGVVLLMLALASLLVRLRDDPSVLGKRYDLTVSAAPGLVPSIEAIPGVAAATSRYQEDVADAFRVGEPLRLIAYGADHVAFDAPPLAEGRRIRGPGEVEVGAGLADALGLAPGTTLSTLSATGQEIRLRVVGVVRALDNQGRIAWVDDETLLRAAPDARPQAAIRLSPNANDRQVLAGLRALDLSPDRVAGATARDATFLGVLASVLRAVALLVGLVCLYALLQALAMTARERRGALAVLRATGADRVDLAALLAGAAAAVAVPAAVLAVLLETLVLGPFVARLAAGYASLPLSPDVAQIAVIVLGLGVIAAGTALVVAARLEREPVVRGLREDG